MIRPRRTAKGFTLAELAVVLVIVGLLLGGLMVPLSTQMDNRYRSDTVKALADIREALIGFAIVNGRLPCPAQPDLSNTDSNAGVEAVTVPGGPCSCTAATAASNDGIAKIGGTACDTAGATSGVNGVLPWATLGLPETDSWGNRYTYRITTRFGQVSGGATNNYGCTPSVIPVTNAAFAICTTGNISILSASPGTTIASGIPAIVVSHGKNGLGAWTTSGNQPLIAAGDELENANGDTTFVSNTTIDDQLIWISPNLLMNRMIAAGKLP